MLRRRFRPFTALLAVLALLFAQGIASVHACDGTGTAKLQPVSQHESSQAMPDCCDEDSSRAPQLPCDLHCQQGNQTVDRGQAAIVPPVLVAAVVAPFAAPAWNLPPQPQAVRAPHLARLTEPPIPIRNCCFRI